MPEKCYPCTWTNLLPMYLDYTHTASNKRMQRRPQSQFLMVPSVPFTAPLMLGDGNKTTRQG